MIRSTVAWVMDETGSNAIADVTRATYAWNAHKRQFTERQIALARDRLRERDWRAERQ